MWDCVIGGGGPAGLTAATYLGRFRRKVLVVDGGNTRLKQIPLIRNVPGFPDGVAGGTLLARLQDQANRYGAQFQDGPVMALARAENRVRVEFDEAPAEALTVLLATGVEVVEPDIPNHADAVQRGSVRYCPICDGYEVRGRAVVVLGGREGAIAEAHFLLTYTQQVSYVHIEGGAPSHKERLRAEAAGIRVVAQPVTRMECGDRVVLDFADGASERYDVLYPSLGCRPRSELASLLGAACAPEGGLIVDQHYQPSLRGLFAAGDVVQGLDQIASACGQAAVAAVAIHNHVRTLET